MAKKKSETTKSSTAKKAAGPSAGKPAAKSPPKKSPSKKSPPKQRDRHCEHEEEIVDKADARLSITSLTATAPAAHPEGRSTRP